RPIRIPDICQRALGKNAALLPRSGGLQSAGAIWRSLLLVFRLQFIDWISIRNSAELIEASSRTPTPAGDSVRERDIECRPIHACLSTGNDLHDFSVVAGVSPARVSRQSEQYPRARPSGSRFVQARVGDGGHLLEQQSPAAGGDRQHDLQGR